jgi:nucleotide-binding universal stress UspA family protein
MIENILFPVDFSPSCVAMAAYVKRTAAMFDSRVTLVHVCDLESYNGFELYVRCLQEVSEEHWSMAAEKLDSFLVAEFPPATCPRVLRSGEAAAQISEVARTGGFDLIILPTHAGRFRQMLLGSTAAKVLNDSECMVLTTEHASRSVPRPLEHREWVCGIGLGEDSERVLSLATRAAAQVGASLALIHAIPKSDAERLESARRQEALHRIGDIQKAVGSAAVVHIAFGPVKEALLQAAAKCAADALIIGRPPSGALGRLRDLTYSLVRDSPFPVLSV